jgi:transcriptional regulator with XRE-family HTH domain
MPPTARVLTLQQRELARRLRELRRGSGLSIAEVAAQMAVSEAKISRLERGERGASLPDVRYLCHVYAVDEQDRDDLMDLARASKERAWYQDYDQDYAPYIAVEEVAREIISCNAIIPGLLQTDGYAHALNRDGDPWATDEQIAGRVEVKVKRQARLTADDRPRYEALVDESALRRVIGGPAVMREQLTVLIERSRLPNVTLLIIPFEAGAHAGVDSNFILLATENPAIPDMIYVEGLSGMQYLTEERDRKKYRELIQGIRKKAAGANDSRRLIERAIELLP